MPTIWFAKDGNPGDRTSGPGIAISPLDLSRLFTGYSYQFISKTAPTFNPGKNSWGAEHVVIEVHEGETDAVVNFGKPGFYLVENMKPSKARELLSAVVT